jgi:hypothetical protein
VHLTGVHLTSVHLTGVYLLQACISFTSLLCAQDTGGENPFIDARDGLKASNCGRLGATETKAAALYPKRYQSLLSKLSTRGGRGGEKKRR